MTSLLEDSFIVLALTLTVIHNVFIEIYETGIQQFTNCREVNLLPLQFLSEYAEETALKKDAEVHVAIMDQMVE